MLLRRCHRPGTKESIKAFNCAVWPWKAGAKVASTPWEHMISHSWLHLQLASRTLQTCECTTVTQQLLVWWSQLTSDIEDNSLWGAASMTDFNLEMCANAQSDGRPAEYRWRPLFNAAKSGWRPLLEYRAVGLRASGNLPVSYVLTGNLPVTYHQ